MMDSDDDRQLKERDWQFILDSIYRINSISNTETFQRETLSCLRTLTPSYQGTFFLITMDNGIARSSRPVIVGAEAHLLDKFMGEYDDDPYFAGLYLRPNSYAFRDTDMIPARIRETSPVYNDIYKPEGIVYGLRVLLAHDNSIIGEVALFNTAEQGDFTEKDLQIANVFASHAALRLAELLRRETEEEPQIDRRIVEEYGLTMREYQVIQLVLEGQTDSKIADGLCISLSTVKKHIYNAYRKMEINNRMQLHNLLERK